MDNEANQAQANAICADCQATIPEHAQCCPHCGCPVARGRTKHSIGVVVLLALIGIAFAFLYNFIIEPNDESQTLRRLSRQFAHRSVRPLNAYDLSCSPGTVAFSDSASAWATGRYDITIVKESDTSLKLTGHLGPIRSLSFAADGTAIVSGGEDQTVKVWDVITMEQVHSLVGHSKPVSAVDFSRDGTMVISASDDHTIKLWEIFTGENLATLTGHSGPVSTIALHPDARRLASASIDGTIRLWDLENGYELLSIETHELTPIRSLLFSPRGFTLAGICKDNSVVTWDITSGDKLHNLTIDSGRVLSLSFSRDGNQLASGSLDGTVIVWDPSSGVELNRLEFNHPVVVLAESAQDGFDSPPSSFDFLVEVGATGLAAEAAETAKPGEKAITRFKYPSDLEITLFAPESMVANPACLCLDEFGRVFVGETFRYDDVVETGYAGRGFWLLDDLASQSTADRLKMYQKWQNHNGTGMETYTKFSERVRRLEDVDGDGHADRASVFSEGYNDALDGTGSGIIARNGAVYYACIPKLWMLTDHDDDGVADHKNALLDGFGVAASLAHGLHGLTWGPDGKLYFSIGDRGYHVERPGKTALHAPGVGAILRCNSDGSELEVVARGLRNPHELAFDQYGNLFTCDNNANSGDKSRLLYVMKGADFGWHMAYETIPGDKSLSPWNMDQMWNTPREGRAEWVLPPIDHISIGPAGMTFYPGVGLPERYQNHFFLCDFAARPEASGILSFGVVPKGAGFQLDDHHSFLSNMLSTDVDFGYDGKMYIADWINGVSGSGLGRIYTLCDPEIVKRPEVADLSRLFREGFESRSSSELAELMHHADRRVRMRAQINLAGRDRDAHELLKNIASKQDNQLARLHAIWGLGMASRKDRSILGHLALLLIDDDDEVRSQAAKVLGEHGWTDAADSIVKLLSDSNARVRSFAAIALGDLKHKNAIEPIIAMLREAGEPDEFLRHAAVYALALIGDPDALTAYSTDPNREVRLAVLVAWRRLRDPRIENYLKDTDETLVLEAARAIHDVPIEPAMASLANLIDEGPTLEPLARRVINTNFRIGTKENVVGLVRYAQDLNVTSAMRVEALRALADWQQPPPLDRVLGLLRPLPMRNINVVREIIEQALSVLLASSDPNVIQESMRLARIMNTMLGDVSFIDWIADDGKPTGSRIDALYLTADQQPSVRDQAIDAALGSNHPLVRAEAAKILAATNPERAIKVLKVVLAEAPLLEQQRAFQTLGTMNHESAVPLLSDWMDRLVQGTVPLPLRLDVLVAASQTSSPLLMQKVEHFQTRLSQSGAVAQSELMLAGGDRDRGRQIFHDPARTQCLRCHLIDDKGGLVGPDLSKIGRDNSREYLLESMLFPARQIAKEYDGVTVTTTDGKTLSGIVQTENDQELTLISISGETLTIPAAMIQDRSGGNSVMPDNILSRLNPMEIRDLVEYMANRK